jgi:endogenous inhibitor of DNA gyrase (YacG/DUF329 family)
MTETLAIAQFTSKTVQCPSCAGSSLYAASNAFRPFCSERCKLSDLGAWASEQFVMPTVLSAEALPENAADSLF